MTIILKSLYTEPPTKDCKIIAFYSDGSGAAVFEIENGVAYDKDGEAVSSFMDSLIDMGFNRWAQLPDNFEMWFDLNGKGKEA